MGLRVSDLDKRICDVDEDAVNNQTYRQVILITERQFGLAARNLNKMTDAELSLYFESIENLWR